MTAIRKALKKYAKNVVATNQPVSGFLALEIEHPNDPGGCCCCITALHCTAGVSVAADRCSTASE
jgi:hypothetical protein